MAFWNVRSRTMVLFSTAAIRPAKSGNQSFVGNPCFVDAKRQQNIRAVCRRANIDNFEALLDARGNQSWKQILDSVPKDESCLAVSCCRPSRRGKPPRAPARCAPSFDGRLLAIVQRTAVQLWTTTWARQNRCVRPELKPINSHFGFGVTMSCNALSIPAQCLKRLNAAKPRASVRSS